MLPLRLSGARCHNLQGVDLVLKPGEIVAVTGVSGAGKSSLAMDTLYAEGQRRFIESFSPYARQFLERLERPPMVGLDPVPAAVAVDRRAPVKNSRSTVATMTDIEPMLAGLFLRESEPTCPEHGLVGIRHDAASLSEELLGQANGARAVFSYQRPVTDAEHYLQVREELLAEGYGRVWRGDSQTLVELDQVRPSDVVDVGYVEPIVDRVVIKPAERRRITESLETAWARGRGSAWFREVDKGGGQARELRAGYSCPTCSRALHEPRRGLFSYDSPLGACAECRGFGRVLGVDLDRVVPDVYKTLKGGAIRPWTGKSTVRERRQLKGLCERNGIPMDVPFRELTVEHKHLVFEGDGAWRPKAYAGVLGWFRWLQTKSYKMHVRVLLSRYRSYDPCPVCNGARLNAHAQSYHFAGRSISEWHELEIGTVLQLLREAKPRTAQGALLIGQLLARVGYLDRVGLGYLNLDRPARTLSGGEGQRVTLTAALGTSLHHAMFVLDEPTIGLHPSDVERLSGAIVELGSRNNVVVLIEHDRGLIATSDRVVELGPGAGTEGGRIVFDGKTSAALKRPGATRRAFEGYRNPRPEPRQARHSVGIRGATQNNLVDVDVDFPLGVLCAVSGPSGSGKSTLVVDVLYRAVARRLRQLDGGTPGAFRELVGAEKLRRVQLVDQSPLGRTSRGNAATYTKAWDSIRRLFAQEPVARQIGLSPSDFSFNVDGGRCEACAGEGYETVEMQFLADVSLLCPVCKGQRFQERVLRVTCRGVSIAELLRSSVSRTAELFADVPAIVRALAPVSRLGLGYLQLGQPLSTLSGGEAQRLKLARALSERLKDCLFVVDEPSAGLHVDEVRHVLDCFNLIVDAGGSVIVVEHDLDVIRAADWVIDMGPAAGKRGGRVVGTGTPGELELCDTLTGHALRQSVTVHKPRKKASAPALSLHVEGAREHNLVDVTADVPHGKFTVVTGPSGSGKSSLVFDVLFAEGQRRFLETLTPYARQFLPTLPKPDVDSVTGVPPSIALEQRTARAGVNSTLATVTELAHYLRLLFAKLAVPHCPKHQTPLDATSMEAIWQWLKTLPGTGALLAPAIEGRKGTYLDLFDGAARDGIELAICDGKQVSTQRPPKLHRTKEHTIDLVVQEASEWSKLSRLQLERALSWGNGSVKVRNEGQAVVRFSTTAACPQCGLAVPDLDPRWFSFNTVQGRCPKCEGSGFTQARPTARGRGSQESPQLTVCSACHGSRLHPIADAARLSGFGYHQLMQLSVSDFSAALTQLRFADRWEPVAKPILGELTRRVDFLLDVGLGYLSLGRPARTLSGGEMQRLRLAAQLGAGLTGALYVLDEPTIGLHPRDTQRLLTNLKALVAQGSTVVVVEHDADVIRAADHLIDMGPSGGHGGGKIVAAGTPRHVLARGDGPTAVSLRRRQALRKPMAIEAGHPMLSVIGAREHNLLGVDAHFPVGRMTVVAGVSGSGKSTLVSRVVLPAVRDALGLVTPPPGLHDRVGALHGIRRALSVDQSPIGRTSRSVPATFLGIWDAVRRIFAATSAARVAGFGPTHFSFNSKSGGRCGDCAGQGTLTHEMSFLPDVVQSCPTCGGHRFDDATLAIQFRGFSPGQVLELTVEGALETFSNHPKITAPLRTLCDLGAGYIRLGQGSHTLSGGEAQRLKLAIELTAGVRHEPTLYVLDEPTTGLHQSDVAKLMTVLSRLVDRGDTLVIVEHHPLVIAGADHVIELGPESGLAGGRVVAAMAPTRLRHEDTATGRVLAGLQ